MCIHLYASNRDAPVGSSAEVKYNAIFINYCVWENVVQDAHYVYARETTYTKLVLARILNIFCFLASEINVTNRHEILENQALRNEAYDGIK